MTRARLFQPIELGPIKLETRVVLAPLTRFRANKDHVHSDMSVEYYAQRAKNKGALLITEGTFISPQAAGYKFVPGIWSDDQVAKWREIVNAVHAQGSYIYMQLWCLGRAAQQDVLKEEFGLDVVSSSPVPLTAAKGYRSSSVPRQLTENEIWQLIQDYKQAAINFVHKAGGDGVEIHGANGYMVDQFTQNTCNKRTDKWGGSTENRCRFGLEVLKAVSDGIGPERTGIRFSPHSPFQDMKMSEADLKETFSYLLNSIKRDYPTLAYVHLTTPRAAGGFDNKEQEQHENLDFLLEQYQPHRVVLAGGYTPETAKTDAEKWPNCMIAFGRHYISNPDLPLKLEAGVAFTHYNRKTFYTPGPTAKEGYTTYEREIDSTRASDRARL
ncbi:hypothetical protein OIO90_001631 [Microbotryomycetes sp. JL221]|nr:hypothetical protein OIO90_001631 [Microbotryomycetes sp. JL221]